MREQKTILVPWNLITMPQTSELYHYGTKRHSGRYPWGSGERPFQRDSQQHKERMQQFKEKAKRVAKTTGRIAANIGLRVGATALMNLGVNSVLVSTALHLGMNYLNKNPDLKYMMASTDMGQVFMRAKVRKESGGDYPFSEDLRVNRKISNIAAEAGFSYMRDWLDKSSPAY